MQLQNPNLVKQNNPDAFALSGHQKLEGAQALHMEETRVKMMMAIGQIPPLDEGGMLEHLHEFALEVCVGVMCGWDVRGKHHPYKLQGSGGAGQCAVVLQMFCL